MAQPADPVLYSFRRCPYAMRARLALAVSGTRCELREVKLSAKPEAMLAASPKGTVPVLVLPEGEVIAESIDIMRWALARHDPDGWLDADDDALIAFLRRKILETGLGDEERHVAGFAAIRRLVQEQVIAVRVRERLRSRFCSERRLAGDQADRKGKEQPCHACHCLMTTNGTPRRRTRLPNSIVASRSASISAPPRAAVTTPTRALLPVTSAAIFRAARGSLSRTCPALPASNRCSTSTLGRLGTVDEAADSVFFFCSPLSDYVTGEVLICGGGLRI